jgi:hypothetical protein
MEIKMESNLIKQLEDKKKELLDIEQGIKILEMSECSKDSNCHEYSDLINEKEYYRHCKEIIAILEQAIAEMQKIQSQQQNHKMTEKECGANTTVEVDKITDTPQNKTGSLHSGIIDGTVQTGSVVSNLQFPELESKKCFSDGFDKGVQFGMQKQRQEEIEFLQWIYSNNGVEEDFDNVMISIDNRIYRLKEQQLNQPKTEK